jgi:hypothetical protein
VQLIFIKLINELYGVEIRHHRRIEARLWILRCKSHPARNVESSSTRSKITALFDSVRSCRAISYAIVSHRHDLSPNKTSPHV